MKDQEFKLLEPVIVETIGKKYSCKWNKHFAYHMSQEQLDIPLEQYSKHKRVELGEKVLKKKRIYLDLKYWIYLRDAYYGKPQKFIHNKIASALYRIVEMGYAICPANYTILNEIAKQCDPTSKANTCRIIDELSNRIIIEPYDLLVDIELTHLASSFIEEKEKLYALEQLVWARVGNILGECIPCNTGYDAKTENALQKTFLDTMSELSFSEITETFASSNTKKPFDSLQYAKNRTSETNKHKNEFNTFQQVYGIELHGLLDEIKEGIFKVLDFLCSKKTGKSFQKEDTKLFINYIFEAFRNNKLSTEFPQLHINAGIHAAIRYKNMPFKKGDFYDHFHASSAIPYCDYFFTEKKLANLLTQKPLNFDKAYRCKILYKEDDILEELKKIQLSTQ